MRRSLVLLSLVTACAPRRPPADASAYPNLPQIRTLEDVRRHEGERAEIHGRYQVTPIDLGRSGRPVTIVLADGSELLRATDPVPGELRLDEQPVVLVGTAYLSSTAAGAPPAREAGPVVRVEKLMAAADARPGPRGELPLLRQVASLPELGEARGRWVSVFGTLRAVHGEGEIGAAEIELRDGTIVVAQGVPLVNWQPLPPGTAVTTVGQVSADEPTLLLGAVFPCRGLVARCGTQ